jgi:hypothetical protein
MEPEGSLQCSEQPAIAPEPKPDKSSPHLPTLSLNDTFLGYFPYFQKIKGGL